MNERMSEWTNEWMYEWMNEWMKPAVEHNNNVKWSESPWNQSGRRGKGLRWKGFVEQVLSSEWKTERVRQNENGDSGDGEDDELPWVISS